MQLIRNILSSSRVIFQSLTCAYSPSIRILFSWCSHPLVRRRPPFGVIPRSDDPWLTQKSAYLPHQLLASRPRERKSSTRLFWVPYAITTLQKSRWLLVFCFWFIQLSAAVEAMEYGRKRSNGSKRSAKKSAGLQLPQKSHDMARSVTQKTDRQVPPQRHDSPDAVAAKGNASSKEIVRGSVCKRDSAKIATR